MKYGIFLARLQPIHNAHIYMIQKILEECDYCICIVGSANKNGTLRNPYDAKYRMKLLKKATKNLNTSRIICFELADWESENNIFNLTKWGHYVYYNIVSRIQQKEMTFYYADSPDYLKSWFDEEIKEYISFRFLEREHIFNNLSATKIREALLNNDIKYLTEFLPKEIQDEVPKLKEILENVIKNPREDFKMR